MKDEITFFNNINGTPLYIDNYLEDNQILKGRKQGDVRSFSFMIANSKTANILYQTTLEYKRKIRKDKLNKIEISG